MSPAKRVTITVRLTPEQAKALAEGVFVCTSTERWQEAQRALTHVKDSIRRARAGGRS